MIIAVDFDGTLCRFAFPEIGEVLQVHEAVIAFIKDRKGKGDTIVLLTCREDVKERAYLSEAVSWCEEHGVPIDYVNCTPPAARQQLPDGFAARKVHADLYIDDRALNVNAFDGNGMARHAMPSPTRLERLVAQAKASGLSRLEVTVEFLEATRRHLAELQLEAAAAVAAARTTTEDAHSPQTPQASPPDR